VLVACALAPVYASDVAHTGPNANHVLDQVNVHGQKVSVVSAGGYIDKKTGKPCTVSGTGCILFSAIPIGPTWFSAGGRYVLGGDSNGRDVAVRPALRRAQLADRRHRLDGDLHRLRGDLRSARRLLSAAGSTS